MTTSRELGIRGAAAGALCLLVIIVYSPAGRASFLNFDDSEYVYANPHVAAGLTASGVQWAFTNVHSANWHPVTWLAHMLDVDAFGMQAGAHHLVNVAFHALNAILLFLLLAGTTGAQGRSFFVAAIFAVHPLNVESVAWVSELKNVLSMTFFLATGLAYVAWVRRRTWWRYSLVIILMALGLMAKPIVVVAPLLLLLLDIWPLARTSLPDTFARVPAFFRSLRPLTVEKLPLIALALSSAVITYVGQASWNATTAIPAGQRLLNAVNSYVWYMAKTVWPAGLSMFYPHPASIGESVSIAAAVASATVLVAVTVFVFRSMRAEFWVGWMWFLIALVPVIGFVQVGLQARADRYAYFAMIGLLIAATWMAADVLSRRLRAVAWAVAVILVSAAAFAAHANAGFWRDNEVLYRHAIDVNPRNWLAWNNLGTHYLDRDRPGDALRCFVVAADAKKDYADAFYNAGVALGRIGRQQESIAWFQSALALDESNADGWVNLGMAFLNTGRLPEAIGAYNRGIRLRPDDTLALYGLTLAYLGRGDAPAASLYYRRLAEKDSGLAADVRRQLIADRR